MFDGGKYSDFVQSILFLSVGQMTDLYFLKGVFKSIFLPLHLVDTAVGAIAFYK